MGQVLHTADVHLRSDDPRRMDALRTLLDRAEELAVDAVTIGGDLFDTPENVDALRTDLRNDLFADRSFEIVLIPGNHDVDAFSGNVFFGDSCTVLLEEPFGQWTTPDGELRITGIPYRDRPDDDLLFALQDRDPFDGHEALLLHCSLDEPFADTETGDAETRRYFPVTSDLLSELGFDSYLAGHYHSPHEVALPNGATFTYPGTPASTKSSETGRRQVSLLDPGTGIDFLPLESFHYVSLSETVMPGREEETLSTVESWISNNSAEMAEATVHVDGFIEMAETAFHEALSNAAGPATVHNETRSVEHVTGHPLYQTFTDELETMDWDEETTEQVRERTLEAFSRLSTAGGL